MIVFYRKLDFSSLFSLEIINFENVLLQKDVQPLPNNSMLMVATSGTAVVI